MDNYQSRQKDTLDLSLQGTAIQPGISSSRPSSARSSSQTKQLITPSRGGNAKDHQTTMTTSINFSTARQRRHSNSSQRSLGLTSPPPPPPPPPSDIKKSTIDSTTSSVFRVLSPQQHDVEGFFTDQSQEKSLQHKTNQWDEFQQLNSSILPVEQENNHQIGPMGMSRDSLNGTNFYQLNDYQQEQPLSTLESVSIEEEKQSPKIISSKEIIQQENNNNNNNQSRSSSRRPSSASSTLKQQITPIPSSHPPSPHIDEKIRTTSSITSTSSSKVTLNDVYETLKQLEEVEQFPIQPPLEDDSVYLIHELSSQTFDQNLSQDEPNPYDLIVESVRSQKSLITPPQSSRRQQYTKLVQSVSIPHSRASPSIDQHDTKITKPSKSLMIAVHPTTSRENNKENEFDHQLQKQKNEYETIIQRHLKFIDQLIDDKKKLSSRCELLISELKTIDRKCNDRIRSIEEIHRNEIQQLKDTYESEEKLRRERWIDDKTQKIKELTVRGLEPEIQKLITKHKTELAKMKTIHEAELLQSDERASQRYLRMIEELRDQLEREKELAIAKERELAREKYEKSLQEEDKSFNEQRRRLYTEIEEEKNRQMELITKQRADLDKLRRDIEENHRTVVESTKRDYESIRLEQERRHTNEINELKEKLNLEKQIWEENYMKKQETILINKERELREQIKQERDKEIEKIIAQFELDTTSTKEEIERTAENRIKRIRDKYETELHELENSEKQTKEKYNQIKAQMMEIQGDNERLQILFKQKELEINDIKKITDTLQQERERLSDIIRQEFADRLVFTDEENRRIKNEIAELRARQQLELEKKKEEIELLQKQQEKELETIHEKIKQAITKKDEQVQALRVQYENSIKRAENLENLLAQQRKLISTKSSTKKTQS